MRGPQHPYTWGLLSSVPSLHGDADDDLVPIKGNPPSLINLPSGCAFHPRCRYADARTVTVPSPRCRELPLRAGRARPPGRLPPARAAPRSGSTSEDIAHGRSGPMTDHRGATGDRPGAGGRRSSRRAAAPGRGPDQALPGARRALSGAQAGRARGRRASTSRCAPARRSAWSASPAAARRRPAACWSACSSRPRARSPSRATTSPTPRASALRALRQDMQIIFQDPYSSLNPRHTVGRIVAMPLHGQRHQPARRRQASACRSCWRSSASTRSTTTGTRTSSPAASGSASASPGRSPCSPKLIVADEPVSALDVSIQAQVINLLRELQRDLGLAFVFIAHDLAVVRHFCERIAVMYLGKIVEIGSRQQIYELAGPPVHPGTALRGARRHQARPGTAGSGSRATCRRRSTRRRAAGSAPAAGRRRTSAPRRCHR